MTDSLDVVVIGGGHNGLVAAGYLARAGRRVVVLERRGVLGGAAASEELFPGFRFDTGAQDAGLLQPAIVQDLQLSTHGLSLFESPIGCLSLLGAGAVLRLWREPAAAVREIESFSKSDAAKYALFLQKTGRMAAALGRALTLTPPNLPPTFGDFFRLLGWARFAVGARLLGRTGMMELLRTIPLSVENLLSDWFESDPLKGALGSLGVSGSAQGPMASGTAFMLLYLSRGGMPRPARFVRGGMGQFARTLALAAQSFGAQIRTAAEVERVLLDDGRAVGVRLRGGEEIRASAVASSADPRHTLIDLVGASQLEVRVVRRVRNIRFRGTTARVNLALERFPHFDGISDRSELLGHLLVSPSLEYLERAYDSSKYGRYSEQPYLDIVIPTLHDSSLAPDGKHILSATMQYAPYHLRDTDWGRERDRLGDRIVAAIAEHAPDLPNLILHRQVLTPLDYEQEYGLPEGCIYHGQMGLDQLVSMRPIPGYGRYRSPVPGLFFCGAGAHPGGGITGAPGRNAAQEILQDLKRRP